MQLKAVIRNFFVLPEFVWLYNMTGNELFFLSRALQTELGGWGGVRGVTLLTARTC